MIEEKPGMPSQGQLASSRNRNFFPAGYSKVRAADLKLARNTVLTCYLYTMKVSWKQWKLPVHDGRYTQWKVYTMKVTCTQLSHSLVHCLPSHPNPPCESAISSLPPYLPPPLTSNMIYFFGVRGLVSGSTGVQNHSPTWSTMVGKSMNSVRGTAGSAFQGQTLWLVQLCWNAIIFIFHLGWWCRFL